MEEVYKVHKIVIMPAENGTIVSVMYCDDPEKAGNDYSFSEDSMVKKKYTADKEMLADVLKAIGAPSEFTEVEEDDEEENGEGMEVKVEFDPKSFKPKKGMKKY